MWKYFSSCQYFNIFSTADKPQLVRDAHAGTPWSFNQFASYPQKRAQLQQEWNEFEDYDLEDDEKESAEDSNGTKCLNFLDRQSQ